MNHTFTPVPAPAPVDLRAMLREHLARRAVEAIHAAADRRRAAMADAASFEAWAARTRATARDILGIGDMASLALNVQPVSRHERPHHVVENVLFESVDGWVVNASVYLPRTEGPHPAIVVPTGHSTKTGPPYQIPCQVFARAGYAAISFDPPGQSGEKRPGNDHFDDGPRCDAVGQTSQRYFIADALRAMDYLASRDDIDTTHGFAMTGVSGGGHTTMWAALLDDRVRVLSPVCCASPIEDHPVRDVYAACSEGLPANRLAAGLDYIDLMAAAAPRPQLYMAGERDEVFTLAMTRDVIAELEKLYAAAGKGDLFASYTEACGHDYTATMARRFVAFADEHLLGGKSPERSLAYGDDPDVAPVQMLFCHPPAEPNMRTISAARAQAMRSSRPRLSGRADAAAAVRAVVPGIDEVATPAVTRGSIGQAWQCDVEELLLHHEQDIYLPATLLRPRRPLRQGPFPAVLHFDDRGRWAPLAKNAYVAGIADFIDRERAVVPLVMSVDLRGWGDTRMAYTPYDLASWSGLDRWPHFIATALGDGLLAQQVRDGLASYRMLAADADVDAQRIVISGHGIGGIVALMVAAMIEHVRGVVCVDTPYSIEAVVLAERYTWPKEIFLHRVLEHFDIEPLAEALAPVLMVRPRDPMGLSLRDDADAKVKPWVWERLGVE